MYAIIETGGKQYKVSEGDVIYIEKLEMEPGEKVIFDKILLVNGKVGQPYVSSATVEGNVEKQGKGKKITIFKYKPKKDSRTKKGHRQPYTKVTISRINS